MPEFHERLRAPAISGIPGGRGREESDRGLKTSHARITQVRPGVAFEHANRYFEVHQGIGDVHPEDMELFRRGGLLDGTVPDTRSGVSLEGPLHVGNEVIANQAVPYRGAAIQQRKSRSRYVKNFFRYPSRGLYHRLK
jgi:hypothetical protein